MPTKRYIPVIISSILILLIMIRGYFLLGIDCAIWWGGIAFATLSVVFSIYINSNNEQKIRRISILIFASIVFLILTFPGQYSSDLAYIIDKYQTTRTAKKNISTVISKDQRFSKLEPRMFTGKGIIANIQGEIETEQHLHDFRQSLLANYPLINNRVGLYWEVKVTKTGEKLDGSDFTLFEEPKAANTSSN